MGRYDELSEAIAAGNLDVVRARVLPDVLVSKGRPSLPLVAFRAGRRDAAEFLLDAYVTDARKKRNKTADPGLASPFAHLVLFAIYALGDRLMTAEEADALVREGYASGLRPALDGIAETLAAVGTAPVFLALVAVLPPWSKEQALAVTKVAVGEWANLVAPEVLSRCLDAVDDVNAPPPGELPLLFHALWWRRSAAAVKALLARGADPTREGGAPERLLPKYAAGMNAVAYARVVLDIAIAGKETTVKALRETVKALEAAAGGAAAKPKKTKPVSPERAAIQRVLEALGTALRIDRDTVAEVIADAKPARGELAKASEDMAYVVSAAKLLGLQLEDDGEADGGEFLASLVSGEPFDGRGTTLDECEDPDAVREVLQHGVCVATSQDASLLVWKREDRVEVWETSVHGRPIVYESVLAWLAKRAPEVRAI